MAKIWIAKIDRTSFESGTNTLALGVYSDPEIAKRALFKAAKKQNLVRGKYENLKWRKGDCFFIANIIKSEYSGACLDCTEYEVDGKLDEWF